MSRKKTLSKRSQKRKCSSEKRHHGGHFIIPEVWGGKKTRENVYTPWRASHGQDHPKHIAYHRLFGNSLPEEAINTIRFWMRKDGQWDMRRFTAPNGATTKRWDDLQFLFDGAGPSEAIEWIKREFIRKEWLKK